MNSLELTDYARRYLEDRFSVLDGVSRVRITGQQVYSMRIWLDRNALVARQLTVGDIENAIRAQNIELPAGSIESPSRSFPIRISRAYEVTEDFRRLVIRRGRDGHLIRLGEVAEIEVAPSDHRIMYRSSATLHLDPQGWVLELDFVDEAGEQLSDHEPVSTVMNWELVAAE